MGEVRLTDPYRAKADIGMRNPWNPDCWMEILGKLSPRRNISQNPCGEDSLSPLRIDLYGPGKRKRSISRTLCPEPMSFHLQPAEISSSSSSSSWTLPREDILFLKVVVTHPATEEDNLEVLHIGIADLNSGSLIILGEHRTEDTWMPLICLELYAKSARSRTHQVYNTTLQ